mgnify:FL=1
MENASKALLMAAGVLIGLMIISLAVFLFSNFGGTSAKIYEQVRENQIKQFNSQFTAYVDNTNVTIYDVVSMANLATQNNKEHGYSKKTAEGKDDYISVEMDGISIEYGTEKEPSLIQIKYNEYISEQVKNIGRNTNLKTYTVTVAISSETGRVYQVNCDSR